MKALKCKLLLLFSFLFILPAFAERNSKKVHQSYPLEQVASLEVDNKFGNIYITDDRTDSVVIHVDIWIEGLTEEKAKNLLNKINVSISKSGNHVKAVTSIDNNFKTRQNFSIDYRISIPEDRELAITQKYGQVNMGNLTGKGRFAIKYGGLNGNKLLSPDLFMDISYSKVDVDATLDLQADLRYSKCYINEMRNFLLESRYSTIGIGSGKAFTVDSRYDNYSIESVEGLKMESMYTGVKIGTLTANLSLENGYGSFKVENIPAGFQTLSVENKYAGIKLGIASDATYHLVGNMSYCKLEHPQSSSLNRVKENTSYEVTGPIGKDPAPKSKVHITSRYGSVSLIP